MKPLHVILLFITIISTACGNKSSNGQVNNVQENPEPVTEWVEVIEETEEECSVCYGSGITNSNCSWCGGHGYTMKYVSGTQPKSCSKCYGTGVVRCQQCDGNNMCQYCNGRRSFQCTVCHGSGLIILDINDTDSWFRCNNCKGTGFEKCLMCGGTGTCSSCDNGLATCHTCWGTGRYGQENYSYTEEEECFYCDGSGRVNNRCSNCDGEGTVIVKRVVRKEKSEL